MTALNSAPTMKLTATHSPATNAAPRLCMQLTNWEVDALCAWLVNAHPDLQDRLIGELPSVACKLYNQPVNVYGPEK